ncbi:MAG: hypothetical protein AB7V27_03605 [Candidatus Binatia bacterium]
MSRRRLALCFALTLSAANAALAEPYFAVREGQKCSACHVNMTGGGMRTSFVAAHAKEILGYPNWWQPLTKPADSFTGEINQYLAIGGDLRVDATGIMQDQPKNGRVNNNKAFRSRLEEFDISVNEAVSYFEVRLIPDVLTFYLDARWSPSVDTREVWAMINLPWDVYLKGGEMFLPYGLQIQDDTAFIRGGRNGSATTGFSFNVNQPAFEIGWEPGPLSVAGAVSQGGPNDRDVQVTGTVYTLFTDLPVVRNVLAGLSGSRVAPSGQETSQLGFFAGFTVGPFTYLGEVDFGHFEFTDPTTSRKEDAGTFIHYSEGNYLILPWLNFKVAFDYADYAGMLPREGQSNAENRFSVGFEPFLARFLQMRFFYRVSNGIASNASHNQGLWIGELHVFF